MCPLDTSKRYFWAKKSSKIGIWAHFSTFVIQKSTKYSIKPKKNKKLYDISASSILPSSWTYLGSVFLPWGAKFGLKLEYLNPKSLHWWTWNVEWRGKYHIWYVIIYLFILSSLIIWRSTAVQQSFTLISIYLICVRCQSFNWHSLKWNVSCEITMEPNRSVLIDQFDHMCDFANDNVY